ncbi:MAG: hypothetical protein U5J83_19130 [Bryobacterales bacterium]|nr:hypothetical protein [Bryobacterales bacterium]
MQITSNLKPAASYRDVLLAEKAQMESARRQSEPLARVGCGDVADQAAAFQDQFITLQRKDLLTAKIKLVDAALARIV